uniref:Uncharacterized protein n=1 Tax=Arundo donax TaxID=35708 RepID=A0A0A8XY28_ARUDO
MVSLVVIRIHKRQVSIYALRKGRIEERIKHQGSHLILY